MLRKKTYTSLLILAFSATWAQKKQDHIALINATAHIGNGTVIEHALVAFKGAKIESVMSTVGLKLNPAAYDTVIDLEGKHIYPALINTNNILGLHDAEAVRATRDFAETGFMNPHVRTLIAYNTDNKIIPTVKTNGILYTQCTPRGGMISGSSSVMALEGWNWEDAVLKADDGIHINFPQLAERKWSEEGQTQTVNKRHNEQLEMLSKFIVDAQAYLKSTNTTEKNIRFEAMRAMLNGDANAYFHVEKAKDILTVISFCQKHAIKKPVIVGGKESFKVTKELRKNSIPVMLNRVFDLPDYTDDDVDLPYKTAYLLQKDSILFCLQLEGDMEAMHSRNLPFNAGATVSYGLTGEEALKIITLNAAKILGLDKMIGSLEEGKLASIVVSDGDILDMKTNNIVFAWIAGKPVTLTNQQTELYEKYKNKYGIK